MAERGGFYPSHLKSICYYLMGITDVMFKCSTIVFNEKEFTDLNPRPLKTSGRVADRSCTQSGSVDTDLKKAKLRHIM